MNEKQGGLSTDREARKEFLFYNGILRISGNVQFTDLHT